MVIVSLLSSRFNKAIATSLLRYGLSARYLLGRGIIRDNPFLDSLLLIPFSQKLISIETQGDVRKAATTDSKTYSPSFFDKFVDYAWDKFFANKLIGNEIIAKKDKHPDIDIFESYIRQAILPNDKWSDVTRWHFNHRFIRWARNEFLIAKHGSDVREALQMYPELKRVPVRRKGKFGSMVLSLVKGDFSLKTDQELSLPSSKILNKAFHMRLWEKNKDAAAEYKIMEKIAKSVGGSLMNVPQTKLYLSNIPLETDLAKLSLENIFELAGGNVSSSGPFNAVCEEADVNEFWTREYVHALAKYLLDRSHNYDGETIIMDVGAGDGILSHFLREFLERELKDRQKSRRHRHLRKGGSLKGSRNSLRRENNYLPKVVATDDGSWKISPKAHVEKLNVAQSMHKYGNAHDNKNHQLIVICSWMPMGEDWTHIIRDGGVDEYILIGEYDDGNCGHNYLTWGNKDFAIHDKNDDSATTQNSLITKEVKAAPYLRDGFRRYDFSELSKLQFSRYDSSVSSSSKTISFRKNNITQKFQKLRNR